MLGCTEVEMFCSIGIVLFGAVVVFVGVVVFGIGDVVMLDVGVVSFVMFVCFGGSVLFFFEELFSSSS